MERFKTAPLLIGHLATLPLKGFVDAARADEVEAFFVANPTPAASLGIAQAVEGIRSRAASAARSLPAIAEYLAQWSASKGK